MIHSCGNQKQRRCGVMDSKHSRSVVIVIIVILLIASLLYYRSVEKRRMQQQEKAQTVQQATKKEAQPKPLGTQPAAPVAPSAPVTEVAAPELTVPPVAPPITAGCKPDPLPVIKQRIVAAPEGMIYVPAGVFVMGSPPALGYADESPARQVCLNGFYIDRDEVTNAQFKKFVDATSHVTEAEKSSSARTWRHPNGPESNADNMPNYPVVCVSWNDANAYARWAGKRLPTEAEWEKTARGTDGRIYPWGNTSPTAALANVADKSADLKWSNTSIDDAQKTAAPVGSFRGGKSVYGADDMAGNVSEWCYDWWNKDYYKSAPLQNPVGPQTGEFRVVRGGSWFSGAEAARTAQRMYMRPESSSAAIGFRCVKDAA